MKVIAKESNIHNILKLAMDKIESLRVKNRVEKVEKKTIAVNFIFNPNVPNIVQAVADIERTSKYFKGQQKYLFNGANISLKSLSQVGILMINSTYVREY